MAWGDDHHAAGASKARYKLARYLGSNGIHIHGSSSHPPEDYDFLVAIKKYAEWYARKHPRVVYKPIADLPFTERLKGLFRL